MERAEAKYYTECGIPEEKWLHRKNLQEQILEVPEKNWLQADIVKGNVTIA